MARSLNCGNVSYVFVNVGSNVVRIFLTTLALTVYEVVLVYRGLNGTAYILPSKSPDGVSVLIACRCVRGAVVNNLDIELAGNGSLESPCELCCNTLCESCIHTVGSSNNVAILIKDVDLKRYAVALTECITVIEGNALDTAVKKRGLKNAELCCGTVKNNLRCITESRLLIGTTPSKSPTVGVGPVDVRSVTKSGIILSKGIKISYVAGSNGLISATTCTYAINIVVTGSCNLICSVAVATKRTGVSGVTCFSTSRSGYGRLVVVLACRRNVVRIFLATLTLTVYEVMLVGRINGLLTLSSVELRDEAVVRNCARSYGCVGLVVSGTEPVVNAANVSDESLAGSIICINSGSSCFISAVYVSSAYNHVDVSLGSTDEAVQIVAALGLLKIYVDSCSSIGYSVHVVTVHCAVEVINLTVVKVALNHTELIAGTNNRVNNYEAALYYRGNVVRILLATRANAINEVVLVYGRLDYRTVCKYDGDGFPV